MAVSDEALEAAAAVHYETERLSRLLVDSSSWAKWGEGDNTPGLWLNAMRGPLEAAFAVEARLNGDRERLLALADYLDRRPTKGAVSAAEDETAEAVAMLRRLADRST